MKTFAKRVVMLALVVCVFSNSATDVVAHDGDHDCADTELDKGRILAIDIRIANLEAEYDEWIFWMNKAIDIGDINAAIKFAGWAEETLDEIAQKEATRVVLQMRIVHDLQHCPDH